LHSIWAFTSIGFQCSGEVKRRSRKEVNPVPDLAQEIAGIERSFRYGADLPDLSDELDPYADFVREECGDEDEEGDGEEEADDGVTYDDNADDGTGFIFRVQFPESSRSERRGEL